MQTVSLLKFDLCLKYISFALFLGILGLKAFTYMLVPESQNQKCLLCNLMTYLTGFSTCLPLVLIYIIQFSLWRFRN